MADDSQRPIVVKKIKKGGHGHHGGAWKIAYADFVTAMMAFFLLMWLLGSTAKGDLSGIAEFFANPLRVSLSGGSGSGDATSVIMAGGNDVTRAHGQVRNGHKDRTTKVSGQSKKEFNAGSNNFEVVNKSINSPVKKNDPSPQVSQGQSREEGRLQLAKNTVAAKEYEQTGSSFQATASLTNDNFAATKVNKEDSQQKKTDELIPSNPERLMSVRPLDEQKMTKKAIALIDQMKKDTLQRELEQEKLATIMRYMNTRIQSSRYLSQFKDQVLMDLTNQGLRIQIVDKNKRTIFQSGQAEVEPFMRPVFQAIGNVLSSVNNFIQLSGHTDETQFARPTGYDNWDLSVDRANAARRELILGGLNPHQIVRISGFADVIPFDITNPKNPQNRRISILVLTKTAVNELVHH